MNEGKQWATTVSWVFDIVLKIRVIAVCTVSPVKSNLRNRKTTWGRRFFIQIVHVPDIKYLLFEGFFHMFTCGLHGETSLSCKFWYDELRHAALNGDTACSSPSNIIGELAEHAHAFCFTCTYNVETTCQNHDMCACKLYNISVQGVFHPNPKYDGVWLWLGTTCDVNQEV